jgi:hypothetical protein
MPSDGPPGSGLNIVSDFGPYGDGTCNGNKAFAGGRVFWAFSKQRNGEGDGSSLLSSGGYKMAVS